MWHLLELVGRISDGAARCGHPASSEMPDEHALLPCFRPW